MPELADALRHISGRRVLDIATGRGGFVHALIDGLKDFEEIVGIDSDPEMALGFAEAFRERPNVRFLAMDAMEPAFQDATFDTVAVSNSLHHFADAGALLSRMRRLVRPSGHIVVAEMFRDHQEPARSTHVLLHHWAAEIDRLEGLLHRQTFTRHQLVRLVSRLGLADLRLTDVEDATDPREPEVIEQIDGAIEMQLKRAAGHPELESQGQSIRQRLHRIGIQGATTLIAVGRTP